MRINSRMVSRIAVELDDAEQPDTACKIRETWPTAETTTSTMVHAGRVAHEDEKRHGLDAESVSHIMDINGIGGGSFYFTIQGYRFGVEKERLGHFTVTDSTNTLQRYPPAIIINCCSNRGFHGSRWRVDALIVSRGPGFLYERIPFQMGDVHRIEELFYYMEWRKTC
ncbi:hypothetical protein BJ742DRAFT_194592 [Cladochytrium replicatum]|nr:hypothetical protein BJ742DRAFT_194592 [Cladochytrium replicatum]